MPLEQMISICKCKNCEGLLFETVTAAIIQQTDNGSYTGVLSIEVWRCMECQTILQPKRITGIGQTDVIRRSLGEMLPENISEPATERVDLNELTGTRKKQLKVPGGLSGMSTGLSGSKQE